MKHTIAKLFTTMFLAGLSPACGSDHMGDDEVSAFGGHIQTARDEVSRHHDDALAKPNLPELVAEVEQHDQRMSGIMDGMNGMMGNMMSHCSGTGMGRMHEMMGAMDSEMNSHGQEMGNVTTLDEGRAQCTAHRDSMNGVLDEMHEGLRNAGCMGTR